MASEILAYYPSPSGRPACVPTAHDGPALASSGPAIIASNRGRAVVARIKEAMQMFQLPRGESPPGAPPGDPEEPSARWLLKDYLEWWFAVVAPGKAMRTRTSYEYGTSKALDTLGAVPLSALTAPAIQAVIGKAQAAGMSDNTVYLIRASLSSALGDAVKMGILPRNPANGVSVRAPDVPDRTILTPAQSDRILDYMLHVRARTPAHAIVAVMLQTGVRLHEGTGLDIEGIRLGASPSLRIQRQAVFEPGKGWRRDRLKTKRARRTLPLPAEAAELVRWRIGLHPRPPVADDWALGSTLERPLSDTAVRSALAQACHVTGAPVISPHDCRRTYATNLARTGTDIVTLAALLGDTTTTATVYVKTDEATMAEAVARLFGSDRTDPRLT